MKNHTSHQEQLSFIILSPRLIHLKHCIVKTILNLLHKIIKNNHHNSVLHYTIYYITFKGQMTVMTQFTNKQRWHVRCSSSVFLGGNEVQTVTSSLPSPFLALSVWNFFSLSILDRLHCEQLDRHRTAFLWHISKVFAWNQPFIITHRINAVVIIDGVIGENRHWCRFGC